MSTAATPVRHSLSARLFRLTVVIVLAVEVLVFVPELSRERMQWLNERLDDARIAGLAAGNRPGQPIDPVTAAELLRLSGTDSIRLEQPGEAPVVLIGPDSAVPERTIVLPHEGYVMRTLWALRALANDRNTEMRVLDDNRAPSGTRISFAFRADAETRALRRFARDFVWVSLAVACLTGALVYVAVALLLVRPMRRLIGSIAAFRAAPERSLPLDPRQVSLLANDEMAVAGRELATMQEELRNALWRNARLAALGSAVARISHDLRGILAPALLAAERLETHSDQAVQRSGEVMLRAVDRATDVVRRTLDFAREGPPPLDLAPVPLAALVDEAGEAVRAPDRWFRVINHVPPALAIEADRNQFFRVLTNLLRNAADAGARSGMVSAVVEHGIATIDIGDDGPGLPDAVRATLFRPFVHSTRHDGAGLGMAIVRDLVLAHGGEIALASTGPQGTVFRLTLRVARPCDAKEQDHREALKDQDHREALRDPDHREVPRDPGHCEALSEQAHREAPKDQDPRESPNDLDRRRSPKNQYQREVTERDARDSEAKQRNPDNGAAAAPGIARAAGVDV